MLERKNLTDISTRRKKIIRARNRREKDYILFRSFSRNGKTSKEVTFVLGAAIMDLAGLYAGDRVRVYTADEGRTVGIGYPKKGKTGWKLCPYSYGSEGYDDYYDAMGKHCTSTFHLTVKNSDKIPLLSHSNSIEIPFDNIDIDEKSDIRIVLEIPDE